MCQVCSVIAVRTAGTVCQVCSVVTVRTAGTVCHVCSVIAVRTAGQCVRCVVLLQLGQLDSVSGV